MGLMTLLLLPKNSYNNRVRSNFKSLQKGEKMKKIMLVVLLGCAAVAVQAQSPSAEARGFGESWAAQRLSARASERIDKAVAQAADKNLDLSGLSKKIQPQVQEKLHKLFPKFVRIVYLGQIGEEKIEDWTISASNLDSWKFYYFVITQDGTDFFYVLSEHEKRTGGLFEKRSREIDNGFLLASAQYDPAVSKDTLKKVKAMLPDPLNEQLKEVLRGFGLGSIQSVKVKQGDNYTVDKLQFTVYHLTYTLTNGAEVERNLVYEHPFTRNDNNGGKYISGKIK